MVLRDYEVIVERKLVNRFVVAARSQAEAAMKIGARIIGDPDTVPFYGSEEIEVDRKMRAPRLVHDEVESPPSLLDSPPSLLDET